MVQHGIVRGSCLPEAPLSSIVLVSTSYRWRAYRSRASGSQTAIQIPAPNMTFVVPAGSRRRRVEAPKRVDHRGIRSLTEEDFGFDGLHKHRDSHTHHWRFPCHRSRYKNSTHPNRLHTGRLHNYYFKKWSRPTARSSNAHSTGF